MKRSSLIVIFIIGICIVVPIVLFYTFVLSGAFAILMPEPPEPQIKYGEFPFRLRYELNGELKEVEDVIVCEFVGYESYGTTGKSRNWDTRLKSGKEKLVLLDLNSENFTDELNNKILELYFYYGNDVYYMENEKSAFAHAAQGLDEICYTFQSKEGEIYHSSFNAEYALKRFNIRLISWDCVPPIENKFE